MLRAGIYPITIAELDSYGLVADFQLSISDHDHLKEFLALHPEYGDVLEDAAGVRLLRWPLKRRRGVRGIRVIYYFRDLNMPLFLLAMYRPRERIPLNAEWRQEIKLAVAELLEQYGKGWARLLDSSA